MQIGSSMKIQNCAYINLDHRTDKNHHINNQLINCPYNIHRIPGVVCENFMDYAVHNYIVVGSQGHKGVIGCWLAHQKTLEHLLNVASDSEYSLILEDDVIIRPNFWLYLDILNFPPDADLIFFDSGKDHSLDKNRCLDHNLNLYITYTSHPVFVGTHCYCIKNSSISKILNILYNTKIYKDIDGFYFNHSNIISYNYQNGLVKINHNLRSDRLNNTGGL